MKDFSMHIKYKNAAASCGFLIFTIGIFGLAVSGQKAGAFPAYSKKEGKNCAFCHVNVSGGGKRNATGKWYKAHGLSLAGYTPEKAASEFGGAAGAAAPAAITGGAVTPPAKTPVKPVVKPSPKPAAKKTPAAKPKPAKAKTPAPKKK